MRSLSAHLRQSGSHGDLPFHPGCPVCRTERLAGSPPGDELLSARSRAGLAAALLACTSVPAAPALATEPDSEQEGAADEKAPGAETDPGFGEGTVDTDLPSDDVAEAPAADDDGEVEPAPPGEGHGQDGPDGDSGDPAGAPGPAPLPPISVPPRPGPPPNLETVRKPDRAQPGEDRRRGLKPLVLDVPDTPSPEPRSVTPVGDSESPAVTSEQVVPHYADPGVAQASDSVEPPAATSRHVRDHGGTHVVRRGESLWSIARDHIGGEATPGQIARLVNRLWELNRERIGTGEPDLLMVGTELRLP